MDRRTSDEALLEVPGKAEEQRDTFIMARHNRGRLGHSGNADNSGTFWFLFDKLKELEIAEKSTQSQSVWKISAGTDNELRFVWILSLTTRFFSKVALLPVLCH